MGKDRGVCVCVNPHHINHFSTDPVMVDSEVFSVANEHGLGVIASLSVLGGCLGTSSLVFHTTTRLMQCSARCIKCGVSHVGLYICKGRSPQLMMQKVPRLTGCKRWIVFEIH